jgi:hypothetical protein
MNEVEERRTSCRTAEGKQSQEANEVKEWRTRLQEEREAKKQARERVHKCTRNHAFIDNHFHSFVSTLSLFTVDVTAEIPKTSFVEQRFTEFESNGPHIKCIKANQNISWSLEASSSISSSKKPEPLCVWSPQQRILVMESSYVSRVSYFILRSQDLNPLRFLQIPHNSSTTSCIKAQASLS